MLYYSCTCVVALTVSSISCDEAGFSYMHTVSLGRDVDRHSCTAAIAIEDPLIRMGNKRSDIFYL